MATKPTMRTPVVDLTLTTREVAQWYDRNSAKLEPVVAGDFGGADAGRAAAALLDGEEQEFQTERREDVAWTNEKDALLAEIGPTHDVITAGVELAYYDDDDLGDVMRDFAIGPASRIRTLPQARKAFQTLKAGMASHASRLAESMAKFDEVLADCERFHERAGELSDAYGKETSETRQAARERKTARQQALDFIDRVHLTARMARRDHPELVEELDAIYAEFVPQPSPAVDDQEEPAEA